MGLALSQTECEHAAADSCAKDGCNTLESGSYKLGVVKTKAPAPTLHAPLFLVLMPTTLTVAVAEFGFTPEEFARPLDWVPSWQFVRRAAPPSRAPAITLA